MFSFGQQEIPIARRRYELSILGPAEQIVVVQERIVSGLIFGGFFFGRLSSFYIVFQ
jgi:hypothetical protein